jgi:hypothetical protein
MAGTTPTIGPIPPRVSFEGGRFAGKPEIIREIRDPATGMRRPILNGVTGEGAQARWEQEHGSLDEPTYLRNRRRRETGEI